MIHLQKMFLRLVSLVVLLAVTSFAVHTAPTRPNGVIPLAAPSFVGVAYAATDPSAAKALTALQDEAGISAYFNKGSSINLSLVRGLFRTIEVDNGSYILGSMQATGTTNYPESEDPHVYVNTNGWVLAYYLNSDPVAKIVDVWNYTGGVSINTKLETVLNRTATAIGIGSGFTPAFYDFRYPNATKLLLIADKVNTGTSDVFEVNLPGTFSFYERSWSIGNTSNNGCGALDLDNVNLITCANASGTLSAAQLGTDQTHTFTVRGINCCGAPNGAVALIYRDIP